MLERLREIDRTLFISVIFLVVGGLFIFLSATLGLLARDGAQFSDVARSQFLLGLGGGIVAFTISALVPHKTWRKASLYLFIASLALTALVFVPGIGLELNGATRWLKVGSFTFQPAEFLKIGYVLYLASWFSSVKRRVGEFQFGLIPFAVITTVPALVLLLQPDGDTFLVLAAAGLAMFIAAGAKWRDIGIIAVTGLLLLTILFFTRDYVADRIRTFIDPSADPLGTSYQLQQSLLAVGAGEFWGRGFGASIQKFGRLPEPISDSIFSVFAEEFGFFGSLILIFAFLTFAMRGLWVAARSPDLFGGLLAVGIVVIIVFQSFLNIASMLGLVPLSGLPLVFVSHGGTALMAALGAVGILLSVSRSAKS